MCTNMHNPLDGELCVVYRTVMTAAFFYPCNYCGRILHNTHLYQWFKVETMCFKDIVFKMQLTFLSSK